MKRFIYGLVFFFLTQTTLAEIYVDGVQGPAWRENSNGRVPLKPELRVLDGENVVTSDDAKVWLKMSDGATVKLGENSRMTVKSISVNSTDTSLEEESTGSLDNFVEASIDILEGAFRYTTGLVDQSWRRDVKVGMVTATIGIRGTDLWGKVGSDSQFVVLLEGNIEIEPKDGSDKLNLDTPLQIYTNTKAEAASLDQVDMAAVEKLAPETELDFGQGVIRMGGRYWINLASFARQSNAQNLANQIADMGYPAEVSPTSVNGQTWYRVAIGRLDSQKDAKSLISLLSHINGIQNLWIQKK